MEIPAPSLLEAKQRLQKATLNDQQQFSKMSKRPLAALELPASPHRDALEKRVRTDVEGAVLGRLTGGREREAHDTFFLVI